MMVLVLVVYLVMQFLVTFRERHIDAQMAARQQQVRTLLYNAIDSAKMSVDSMAPDRQRLTFQSEVLFPTCGARLRSDGSELMSQVGQALSSVQTFFEAIQIDGHTDWVPIGVCPFESNWELSSRRATSVVHILEETGAIDGQKLSATGRAEFHPADPDRPEDLERNRRIEVLLLYSRTDIEQQLGR